MEIKLPDIDSKISDYGLGKTGKLKSGTFALIGFADPKLDQENPNKKVYKIKSPKDADELGFSSLRDTILDFYSYASGTIYCYPMKLKNSIKTTYTISPSSADNNNFSLTVKEGGKIYKDNFEFVVEIYSDGKASATGQDVSATFIIKYEGKIIKPKTFSTSEFKIEELGISITLKAPTGGNQNLKKGQKVIVKAKTELKSDSILLDIEKAHDALLNVDDIIEYFAYDFGTDSSVWKGIAKQYEDISTKYKREFFGVTRFRNLKESETSALYLKELKKEVDQKFSSFRILVLGQPVYYRDYSGFSRQGIPFGYFLARLSTAKYYESLNAIGQEYRFPGIISLDPFTLANIEEIYGYSYTGFRYISGFKGVYLTEALLLSGLESDFDSIERIRIMCRASFVARIALMGSFLNRNFNVLQASEDDSVPAMIKEIVANAFETHLEGAFAGYEIEIRGFDEIVETNKIEIFYKIVPKVKVKYIVNTFTYALPKAS